MKIKSRDDIAVEAIRIVNREFDYNIRFKKCQIKAIRNGWFHFRVTLEVFSSKEKGARIGISGRRVKAACWHVYGRYIDTIFQLDEEAVVWTAGKKYTKNNWVWEDRNVGSILSPIYYSTLCKCV